MNSIPINRFKINNKKKLKSMKPIFLIRSHKELKLKFAQAVLYSKVEFTKGSMWLRIHKKMKNNFKKNSSILSLIFFTWSNFLLIPRWFLCLLKRLKTFDIRIQFRRAKKCLLLPSTYDTSIFFMRDSIKIRRKEKKTRSINPLW